ncbi:MAG: nucleotidyltransferase family protein [Candidatus Neomarinimicrobiota bacterium]
MSLNPSVLMIVPAAGRSTRQPPNKLLHQLAGMTVIESTIAVLKRHFDNIVTVVGYDHERVKESITKRFYRDITIIENPDYTSGVATSINCVLQNISLQPFKYIGFCNGDYPFIKSGTIKYLLQELWEHEPLILAPTYEGIIGHPNFFSINLKNEFLETEGDVGGRDIIKSHIEESMLIPVEDRGVNYDMDQYLDEIRNE